MSIERKIQMTTYITLNKPSIINWVSLLSFFEGHKELFFVFIFLDEIPLQHSIAQDERCVLQRLLWHLIRGRMLFASVSKIGCSL